MKGESLQWLLEIINTLHTASETFGKISEKVPDSVKQRLPGFLGISYEDERLFNGVLCQLKSSQQVVITSFLSTCKDFQKNRFINIVAGMEVEREKKTITTDPKTKKQEAVDLGAKKDRRQEFLKSFAKVITTEFQGDFKKALEYCLAGRLMMPDRTMQPLINAWKDSCQMFSTFVLLPFGVSSSKELIDKAKAALQANAIDLGSTTTEFKTNAKAFFESTKGRR